MRLRSLVICTRLITCVGLVTAAMVLAVPAQLGAQQVLLDSPVEAGGLTLYPVLGTDLEPGLDYYYVPNQARLAEDERGRPQFSFLRYVDNVRPGEDEETAREGDGGGIVHAVVQLDVDDRAVRAAENELGREHPGARIVGPVIYRSGTFGLVSSFMEEDGELTRRVVGLGAAPVLEGSRAAISIRLTKLGSKILWESFEMTQPDVSFVFEMEVAGLRAPVRARLEADWDRIYKHQSFQAAVSAPVLAGEVSAAFDDLRDTGAIRLVQVGEDAQQEKMVQAAYDKLMTLMLEPVEGTGMPSLGQLAGQAGGGGLLDRATKMLKAARDEADKRVKQVAAAVPAAQPTARAAAAAAKPSPTPPRPAGEAKAAADDSEAGGASSGGTDQRELQLANLTVAILGKLQGRLERHVANLRETAGAWQDEATRAAVVTKEEKTARRRAAKARSDLGKEELQRRAAGTTAEQFSEIMESAKEKADELEARGEDATTERILEDSFKASHIAYTDAWIDYNRMATRLERSARKWEQKAAAARTERGNAEVEASALASATARELETAENFLADHEQRLMAARAHEKELSDKETSGGRSPGAADNRLERLATLRSDVLYLRFRMATFLAYSDALRAYAVSHGDLTEEQAELLTFYRDPPLEELQLRKVELLATMQEIDQLEDELGLGEPSGRPDEPSDEAAAGNHLRTVAVADAEKAGPPPKREAIKDDGEAKEPASVAGVGAGGARGGDAGASESKPSFAVVAALQLRKRRQSGTFELDMSKYMAGSQVINFAQPIGDLRRYKDDDRVFREINLDQPLFRQREVAFRLDGLNAEDFGEYVNFVNVQLRRGEDVREELTVGAERFNERGHDFRLLYGFSGEESRDEWMEYEYRTVWSLFGGLSVEEPWQTGRDGTVALPAPYVRRTIDLEGSASALEGVGAVTVHLYYAAGEAERFSEAVLRPGRGETVSSADVLLPVGETEYEYEITWLYGNNSSESTGRQRTANPILFLNPPQD
ncbi:MAG: hypothetical protein ABFS14_08730 [Gemmatimonadota bacterium]